MNALEIRCPKCKGPLEREFGWVPAVHWSFAEWAPNTKKMKKTKRGYYHCSNCNKDFIHSYAMVEVDREKMKVKRPYI